MSVVARFAAEDQEKIPEHVKGGQRSGDKSHREHPAVTGREGGEQDFVF